MRSLAFLCAVLAVAALCMSTVHAEVYYHEEFKSLDGWVQSKHRSDYGTVALSAGKHAVDAGKETGLQLTQDARFYAVSKKLPTPVDNTDKDLVISFAVKSEQQMTCGGNYIKLFSELDQEDFHSESKYWLMFGPDLCGPTNRIHIIFNHNGQNLQWRKEVLYPADTLTHVYTLSIHPDNTFELFVDGESKGASALEDDWDFLEPKTVPDPTDKKPDDWVEDAMMDDPADAKPADWGKEPATIVDPEAKQPEDWDAEEDGEWEAPVIPNPKYQGEWKPRRVANPAYKGVWTPNRIPNKNYKPDANLYKVPAPLQYVGIDVWQVEAGSIFSHIVLADDQEKTLQIVKDTYGSIAKQEKAYKAEVDAAAEATKQDATPRGAAGEDDEGDL